jgi:hypothetical protein
VTAAAIATTPLPPSEAEPDATEAAVRQVLRNGVEKDEKKR